MKAYSLASGPRFSRALRVGIAAACLLPLCAPANVASPRQEQAVPRLEVRFIVGDDVFCRSTPDVDSPPVALLQTGDYFRSYRREATGRGIWHLGQTAAVRQSCWVYDPLTMPAGDPRLRDVAIALAERTLAREAAAFEDFIAVDNLMHVVRGPSDPAAPLFELRHLESVDAAGGRISQWEQGSEPLPRSWLLSHEDVLRPNGIDADLGWFVPHELFLALYRENADSEHADRLAWTAASRRPGLEACDGAPECELQLIIDYYMWYWATFPDGAFVSELLGSHALPWARRAAANACLDDSPYFAVPGEPVDAIEQSLGRVSVPEREETLSVLAEIRAKCML